MLQRNSGLGFVARRGFGVAPLPLAPTTDPTAAYLAGQAAGIDQGQTDLLDSLAAQGYSLTGGAASVVPAATSTINPLYLIGGVVALVLVLSLGGRR